MLDKQLMEIIACPACKGKVQYNDAKDKMVCKNCELEFPIRDDIPLMLVDEATSAAH
ncbi:MAG: Trm112 family protein [Mariprofundaceae bacterium]